MSAFVSGIVLFRPSGWGWRGQLALPKICCQGGFPDTVITEISVWFLVSSILVLKNILPLCGHHPSNQSCCRLHAGWQRLLMFFAFALCHVECSVLSLNLSTWPLWLYVDREGSAMQDYKMLLVKNWINWRNCLNDSSLIILHICGLGRICSWKAEEWKYKRGYFILVTKKRRIQHYQIAFDSRQRSRELHTLWVSHFPFPIRTSQEDHCVVPAGILMIYLWHFRSLTVLIMSHKLLWLNPAIITTFQCVHFYITPSLIPNQSLGYSVVLRIIYNVVHN